MDFFEALVDSLEALVYGGLKLLKPLVHLVHEGL
jgi:hypothetical protein